MAGETVVKATTADAVYSPLGPLLSGGKPIKFEALAAELELADQYLIGYIPAGVTFVGAILKTDDLDSGSEALVWTLNVGAVAFDTTTNALAFAGILMTGDFITTTAETPIYLIASTAATTAAAGTINFMPLYLGS